MSITFPGCRKLQKVELDGHPPLSLWQGSIAGKNRIIVQELRYYQKKTTQFLHHGGTVSIREPKGPSGWHLFYLILFYLIVVISYFHSLKLLTKVYIFLLPFDGTLISCKVIPNLNLGSSLHPSQVTHHVGAYPCFCSMKWQGVFLLKWSLTTLSIRASDSQNALSQ